MEENKSVGTHGEKIIKKFFMRVGIHRRWKTGFWEYLISTESKK